ncbi:hypothetical protein ACGFS9_25365 [Streptomyces sp. NPDC048566]|uniref:hypothetical protein n=1 Tax=Streptomyces sp. NPDC048566 TaxID=3365569 RepID=UPI00371DC7D9
MNVDWLIRGRDGRLCAYLPAEAAIRCRAERGPGGPWGPPRTVGGGQRLHPVLALGQGADRYTHLVSWRPTVREESGLVHSTHYRADLAALDWHPIGHPDRTGGRTGDPALAVDADGRAHVFVRNGSGGVSMIAQKPKGGWGPWRDLKGSDVRGTPAAVTGASGRVELYAAVSGGVLHWRQPEAGADPAPEEQLEAPVRPDTLRALATSADSTTLFYTDTAGDVCAWRPGARPAVVLAAAGPGPVGAIRCELDGHDCTLLAQRSAGGRVAFAAYPTEDEAAGAWWTESGPELPADALVSLAEDEDGRVVAASLSPGTGELLITRRKPEPVLALEPWQAV